MSVEYRPSPVATAEPDAGAAQPSAGARRRRVPAAQPLADDSRLAIEIRGLVERGEMDAARERFGDLVALHQRRASRIAYQYPQDTSEADRAVQARVVKGFSHI